MKVYFIYSKELEINRVLNIYDEYLWFKNNDFPIVLPSFFDKLYDPSHKDKFESDLRFKFDEEYDESAYQTMKKRILKEWAKVEKEVFNILSDLGFDNSNIFNCVISKYGPEGQFETPNTINLRLSSKKDFAEASLTIVHEIIHLLIYKKTDLLNLSYEKIEGVVDLFFKKTELRQIFPAYEMQSIADHDELLFEKIRCNSLP